MFPEHVINRIKKAHEVYDRINVSHADSEYTRLIFFGQRSIEHLKEYGKSIGLPDNKIDLSDCKDIASMVQKIWNSVKHSETPPRVYLVASNWQWIFLDMLINIKNDRFRFYFEGAVDERHPDEIEKDKRMERIAKIEMKENRLASILDKVGGSLSENLKG
ncbi:MAG: hypothetical protein QW769_09635 [Nitrososphaerales archaeon]